MGIKSLVKQALMERENRKYDRLLQERQMTYSLWCQMREAELFKAASQREDAGIKGCLKKQAAEYVLLVSDGGVPAQYARKLLETYFAEHPKVQLVYGDEDVWERFPEGERCMPWFKPDWSPHLFRECFYFGGLTAVRREFYEQTVQKYGRGMSENFCRGGERLEKLGERTNDEEEASLAVQMDSESMISLVSALVEEAGGYEPGCGNIGHLHEVLFHQRSREALTEVLRRRKENRWNFSEARSSSPLISIIIPSKDHPEILTSCLKAIPGAAGKVPWEVLVVDNGSGPENQARVRGLLEKMPNARYLYEPMEFHFSRMCNLGAREAKGDFLLFLNDDVELCTAGSIRQMYGLAKEPFTGAVGMKLYYPDSVKIQHAGVTNLPMGPVHKLQFLEDTVSYYFDSNRGSRNVLAVTAACLMVEKRKFQETGGFSDEFRVAFNDVELCFRLWELGYSNVCMNGLFAYHHESLSRGDDESEDKLNRLLQEREILYEKHPNLDGADPYYSVHLNRQGLDTRIRPAFETAGNVLQEWKEDVVSGKFAGYRQDNCLLVRVESAQNGEICGYCVVLGDDNACYEKSLVLRREEPQNCGEQSAAEKPLYDCAKNPAHAAAMQNAEEYFAVLIEGQYRPDLIENMPDQKNAGLSGFWIKLPVSCTFGNCGGTDSDRELPPGRYRIGAAARNRVTGTKLINWTNHTINIVS